MADKNLKKVRTSTLLRKLFNTPTIESFLKYEIKNLEPHPFHTYLNNICESTGQVPEHVISRSAIDRTYGHQLFNGRRNPSRDKVIQLAFGLKLDLDETQSLLQAAQKSALYPKVKRDAAIIFCLHHEKDIFETQEVLKVLGLTMLGK